MGLNTFSMEAILHMNPDFFEEQEGGSNHLGGSDVSSIGLQFPGNLHAAWFNMFMMDLLRERAADIYRSKGLLSFHGQGNTKFVFQGVHEQINFGPAQDPWKDDEERINKFVFIGRNLNRAELTKGLMECIHKEESS
jgi:G3E family GTPase